MVDDKVLELQNQWRDAIETGEEEDVDTQVVIDAWRELAEEALSLLGIERPRTDEQVAVTWQSLVLETHSWTGRITDLPAGLRPLVRRGLVDREHMADFVGEVESEDTEQESEVRERRAIKTGIVG